MPVRRAARQRLRAYDDAAAGPEVDHHRLPPALLELLRDRARQRIVGAAGRLRHEQGDRLRGERVGGPCDERAYEEHEPCGEPQGKGGERAQGTRTTLPFTCRAAIIFKASAAFSSGNFAEMWGLSLPSRYHLPSCV